MPGRKTHEQQIRMFERKSDVPDARRTAAALRENPDQHVMRHDQGDDWSPVSPQGVNSENRDHNKHNNPGQTGHKPQKHSPDEEKS